VEHRIDCAGVLDQKPDQLALVRIRLPVPLKPIHQPLGLLGFDGSGRFIDRPHKEFSPGGVVGLAI
jgi:hypothetical protein